MDPKTNKTGYGELVDVYTRLESTTKRLEKTKILSAFFSEIDSELLPIVTIMSLGEVFPIWSEEELGIGSKILEKAIASIVGTNINEVENQVRDQGDIGAASEYLFNNKTQTTFFSKPLTISKIYHNLREIASISGNNAQSRKTNLIHELLSSASPIEAKYITRTILEELRVGVGEGTIRDAICDAFNVEKAVVDRAFMLTNDLGLIAVVAKNEQEKGLKKLTLTPDKPVKPMLAQLAPGIKETIMDMGRVFCETKYDGIRVQIHSLNGEISIFTRRLENISHAIPDVIKYIKDTIPHSDFIVEGEIIVIKNGKPISFQHILQRIKRKYDIEKAISEVPLSIYLFDALYFEKPLIDEPLERRRSVLRDIVKTDNHVSLSREVTATVDNIDEAEFLFNDSIKQGHEGIMLKDPQAPYVPGNRGKKMLKFKAEPETLDLVVVGGTYGKGKRGHFIGSYLMAIKDNDNFKTIAHVATGLDDDTLKLLTEMMKKLIINRDGSIIKVKPEIILEIAYSEIVKSPEYECGYSLRFPVVKRIRNDIGLDDIDTMDRLLSMIDF